MLTGELVSKVFMSAFEFIDVFNGARRSLAKRIEGGRVPPTALSPISPLFHSVDFEARNNLGVCIRLCHH